MRINEYISEKDKKANVDNKGEKDISQTQDQKAALQSIKAKTKQNRVLCKDALRQIKKQHQDNRKNND
jgi:hypothetical protein